MESETWFTLPIPMGLLVITQLQPIAVIFTCRKTSFRSCLPKLRAGSSYRVEAYDRDNTTKIADGKLLTIDNQIDPTTGTYKLKAVFTNDTNMSLPQPIRQYSHACGHQEESGDRPDCRHSARPARRLCSLSYRMDTVKIRTSQSPRPPATSSAFPRASNGGDVVVIDGQDKLQDGSKVRSLAQANASSACGQLRPVRQCSCRFTGFAVTNGGGPASDESVSAVYFAACRDHAADGRRHAGWLRSLPPVARVRASAGRLSDDSDADFLSGRQSGRMASSVTAPLERQFGQIPGLKQMTSTSSFGSSIITLQFNLDLNIDIAEQEVQASINAASNLLPQGLPNPPIYSKINPADAPILTLALTSDTLPLSKVEDLADTTLAQKISQLSGVGLVSISGGQRPAVRVQANPTALASYGLSLEDLRTALGAANVDQAKGTFDGLIRPTPSAQTTSSSPAKAIARSSCRLSQRRSRPSVRRRHRYRWRGKH